MGREIKRVAEDFSWPVGVIWKGYRNPYRPTECHACKGSGMSPETKKLSDDWYTHLRTDGQEGWSYHLKEDDIAALMEADRLRDFTHTWSRETGWKRREDKYVPTPEEVNAWARRGFGHDSINCWVCVKSRAKRLGLKIECSFCNGQGHYWCEDKYERRYENWKSIEPPEGDAYQLWETVSEGSPISPPFLEAKDLAAWLAKQKKGWFEHSNHSQEEWLKFILESGWAPSLIIDNTGVHDGIVAPTPPKAE